MKKFGTLIAAFAIVFAAFSASTPSAPAPNKMNANTVMIPVGSTGKMISLKELSTISATELEAMTGRKMGFGEKFAFNKTQKKLKKSIEADGTINSKKVNYLAQQMAGGGFHLGGFVLGLLIGLIGVLIAYLINDDKKKSRVTWAWIGFAVWAALVIIFAVI